MKETGWGKEEEQREASHYFVTVYKQESSFTPAELAGLLAWLSSVTIPGTQVIVGITPMTHLWMWVPAS